MKEQIKMFKDWVLADEEGLNSFLDDLGLNYKIHLIGNTVEIFVEDEFVGLKEEDLFRLSYEIAYSFLSDGVSAEIAKQFAKEHILVYPLNDKGADCDDE